MKRYNVTVFTNDRRQACMGAIGNPDGAFEKSLASDIASQVNAILYQLQAHAYAEVTEVDRG